MCWLWHKYGKWVTVQSGPLIDDFFAPGCTVGAYVMQQKVCVRCGKKKLRRAESI
jgi:hypothetical protein